MRFGPLAAVDASRAYPNGWPGWGAGRNDNTRSAHRNGGSLAYCQFAGDIAGCHSHDHRVSRHAYLSAHGHPAAYPHCCGSRPG